MREWLWRGFPKIRQDGSSSDYLAISLGKAAEYMPKAEPEQQAMVRIIDEETIEIKLVSPEYDADEEDEHD
jgi:hypothetical protein